MNEDWTADEKHLRTLIEKGEDVNLCDGGQRNLLMYALDGYEDWNAVGILLEHGDLVIGPYTPGQQLDL
jgi:hypothetical protein